MNKKEFLAFEEFIDLLYAFSRNLYQYDTTARTYGTDDLLFMTEVHTIRAIGREPKITITEIAKRTNKTKSAVSQMMDKLQTKGLVEKVRDSEDQRRFILQLTDKGKTIYDFHEKLDEINYTKIFEGLNDIKLDDLKCGTKLMSEMLRNVKPEK